MIHLIYEKNKDGGLEIYSKSPFFEKSVADVWRIPEQENSLDYQKYLARLFVTSPQMKKCLSRIYETLQKNKDVYFWQDFFIILDDIFEEELSPEFLKELLDFGQFTRLEKINEIYI